MAKVQVWNDNEHPYSETFKGDPITIGAHKHIMMEEDEAVQFKGTFSGRKMKGDGTPDPTGFKMIRIVYTAEAPVEAATPTSFKCNACKYSANSEKDLLEHSTLAHADQVFVDEGLEKEIRVKKAAVARAG